MNERQFTVCAIALFCDGWSSEQIAFALDVDEQSAQKFIETGAEEQAAGTMGYMHNCPAGEDQIVGKRSATGEVLSKVKRV